jgi:hypothetical protein
MIKRFEWLNEWNTLFLLPAAEISKFMTIFGCTCTVQLAPHCIECYIKVKEHMLHSLAFGEREINFLWLWIDLEERAFVAENGPEAAGFVDQIAGAVSAISAGGCVNFKKSSQINKKCFYLKNRNLQKMLKKVWSFSELDSAFSWGGGKMLKKVWSFSELDSAASEGVQLM